MFENSSSDYFYKEISGILNGNFSDRNRIIKYYSIFKELLNYLIRDEQQVFSTYFSKLVFILDNYKVPDDLSKTIWKFRNFSVKVLKDSSYSISQQQMTYHLAVISEMVEFFSDVNIPEEIQLQISDFVEIQESKKLIVTNEKISLLNCVCIGKIRPAGQKRELLCQSEDYGIIKLELNKPWTEIFDLAYKGAVLNLIDVFSENTNSNVIKTGMDTLISLEPDYLIDATELAECFLMQGFNPKIYFLSKFFASGLSESLVVGNIINACFDELLKDVNAVFIDIFNRSVSAKPLQIFVLALRDKNLVNIIKQKALLQFEILKKIIKTLKVEILNIEPSFISPKFGLQGRLDALLEYYEDKNKKDIIELKSGSSPTSPIQITTLDNKKTTIYIWNNNLAQTTCYNLLLDSTYQGRTGNSSILYAGSSIDPLRDAENIFQKKQEVLILRNWIVAYEKALKQGNYNIFEEFTFSKFGNIPVFSKQKLKEFDLVYNNTGIIEREYFQHYITFIFNELTAVKLGNGNNNRGFSALWQDTIAEKEENYSILTDLTLDRENSDFENFYLILTGNNDSLQLTSLRKGDMVILYPVDPDGTVSVLSNQVLKSSIKSISDKEVKISLRNKLFDKKFLTEDKKWIIEPDYFDSNYKKLLASVYSLISAGDKKRNLLLGLSQPETSQSTNIFFHELNENQNEIINKAIRSKDYFLIQGPPGTGKTSYLLKNLVEYSHNDENKILLVLAYTNRAVDELCSALKKTGINFLRTGSKESSEHSDVLISKLSEEISNRELFIKIRDCRVFVSTVSFVISNPEILELKKFNLAVVDEASQILEPQIIGILSKIEKFILIGDEKQLPAIVSQDQSKTVVKSDNLKSIYLNNPGGSLFERLLNCCKANGWDDSYGMLIKQARMHEDIQEFPNKYFYNNALKIFHSGDRQSGQLNKFKIESIDPIVKTLSESRVLFYNSVSEKQNKVNYSEIAFIQKLLSKIKEVYANDFNNKTVGIISPFRAQCAEIYRTMEIKLRDLVMVDTVERFQGSERDIIIISMAVNHEFDLKSISSFIDKEDTQNSDKKYNIIDRKLNVAMTRAKNHLIFLGNAKILEKSLIYSKLIEFIKDKRAYYNL